MDEKIEEVYSTFCPDRAGHSSRRNLHNSIPCWDTDPKSVRGASGFLAWSMARSYCFLIIHSQLV